MAEYVDDALAEVGSTQVEHLLPVAVETETALRIYQDYPFKSLRDVAHLRGIGLKELPACRNVEEYVLDKEVGTHRTRNDFLLHELGAVDAQARPHFAVLCTGLQRHLRHRRNAGKGLTAESHSMKGEQVGCLTYLRGRMAFKRQACIGI